MALQIQVAQKFNLPARVAIWGTFKTGKTHAALALAKALAGSSGRIGVVSSEHASSQLLQHHVQHDIVNLAEVDENSNLIKGAFSAKRYEEAIKLFTADRYDVIVIDSLSHVWEGEGGILETVSSKKGNTFNDGWGESTPIYKHLVNTILAARCHVIITLRSKDEYRQEEYKKRDGSIGFMPKNVGQAPIIRKGFMYEMHLVIRMDNMVARVEATAMQDYIPYGEEITEFGPEFAGRLLDALDGAPLPEPTEQQKEMRILLDVFYSLAPDTYDKYPNWEKLALGKALGSVPKSTDYTDDDVEKMRKYVVLRKREKEEKEARIEI